MTVTAAGSNCTWTNISNSNFITITSGSAGSGSETVNYTVAADTDTNSFGRTGTMTIAGRTFTVTQASLGCAFTLNATNTSYNASGGSGTVTVNVNGLDCAWTAVSNSGFITITSGGGSGGSGTVSYSVAPNTNSFPSRHHDHRGPDVFGDRGRVWLQRRIDREQFTGGRRLNQRRYDSGVRFQCNGVRDCQCLLQLC